MDFNWWKGDSDIYFTYLVFLTKIDANKILDINSYCKPSPSLISAPSNILTLDLSPKVIIGQESVLILDGLCNVVEYWILNSLYRIYLVKL